jgi:hypothetical protein
VLMEARECEFNVTALLGLKLLALVDHFMVLTGCFFQCLTNFLFIIVALHPESNRTLNL